MFLLGVPLLIIPLAFYNIVVFLLPGLEWAQPLAEAVMPSGATWTLTLGDFLIAVSVFILFLEVAKAIRAERRGGVDHALSVILFVGMLAEFLLVKQAATPTFFLLLVACLVDMIAGFAFSLKEAHRKVVFEGIDQTQAP
jgi:hypothetical protein